MTLALIFDLDGTLFQTNKILEISLEDTFNQLRTMQLWEKETPIEKYREIMGVSLPVVWETLLPTHSNEVREQANEFFHEKLVANINEGNGALYPHVEEVFDYLKNNNCSIYIASNGQREYLKTIVDYYNLDKWVMETFSIQQIPTQDKADLVKSILMKYQMEKGAVIGDRLSDINAAKNNRLISIGCKFDFAQEDELAQADIIIDSLLELKPIFAELNVADIEGMLVKRI
ncbi:NIF family HAD-type phosphatase [Neobacillus soli]|uniref:NIF family HAD-type phosphatase n=1 Tax=Neobacillus soli TaxID=220688 RepID=UPI000826DDF4|nr:NIF family HAD-type phosphatase [Neobacillus soli]